jgi:multidrug resistance protein, MATE family
MDHLSSGFICYFLTYFLNYLPCVRIVQMITWIKNRYSSPSGYKELLKIAFPLILSSASWSFMHFIDRMFLTWYSPDAIAASMPAGILNFTLMSLFIGAAGYASTFVAQYHGAGRDKEIGTYIWQGIYVSIIGAIFLTICIPLSPVIFPLFGHGAVIAGLENQFFQALCIGAFPAIANSALSSFYAGIGKTAPVLLINVLMAVINIILDYLFIFGNLGFPQLGVFGAGLATTISAFIGMGVYIVILFTPAKEKIYGIFSRYRFKKDAFLRLIRFGVPSGFQLFMDVAGFTAFIFIIGNLGREALAASNIAFSINTLAFMPMVGMGIAVSVLVGQNIGKNNVPDADKVTFSGYHIAVLYMGLVAVLYLFFPGIFLNPFLHNEKRSAEILSVGAILLKFIAVYSLFDAFGVVFGSALKGAGDTRFIMIANIILSVCLLVIPAYIMVFVLHLNVYYTWIAATVYVITLALTFFIRFQTGKWKSMRVIEENVIAD